MEETGDSTTIPEGEVVIAEQNTTEDTHEGSTVESPSTAHIAGDASTELPQDTTTEVSPEAHALGAEIDGHALSAEQIDTELPEDTDRTAEQSFTGIGPPGLEQLETADTTQPTASHAAQRQTIHRQLSPDEVQMLLRPPSVDNKGPFSPPWQLVALAAGVRLEITESGPGCGAQMSISAPSEERLLRAQKYVRLVLSSERQWCKVDVTADDNKDLTLLQCPEELWSWVLGKQDGNLHTIAEDNGVLIFVVGEWRKLGEAHPSAESWLHLGSSVDVRMSGDIREANWSTATVVEILKSQTLRVKTKSNVVKTVEIGNVRPHLTAGAAVEVLSGDDSEHWIPATFSERVEGTDMVKVQLEGSTAEKEVDAKDVRPVQQGEQSQEPTFQVAIFGEMHGRCAAQLRFMSAVDWKRPGYYPGPMNLCMPPEADWRYQIVELASEEVSKCIGTKGDIRRQLCRASDCVIDCLGTVFYVCGPDENCTFGVNLLGIVRDAKKGAIEGIPDGVEDYIEVITIPDWIVSFVAGKGRKRFEQIEQKEGVMIFLFKPPQPLQEVASSVRHESHTSAVEAMSLDEPQEEPKTLHEQNQEAETSKTHADAECGEHDDTQEQEWEDGGSTTVIFVFAFSAHARLSAHLRLCRAVEQKLEGYCMRDIQPVVHEDDVVITDVIQFAKEQRPWLTGKSGRNQKAVEAASGCAMEYFSDCAHIVGAGEERMRGRSYLAWLLQQDPAVNRRERLVEVSADELKGRDDIYVLMVSEEERTALLAGGRDTLDNIEVATGTFIFFRKVPNCELWLPGRRAEITCDGRRFMAEVVAAPGDTDVLQFRLCDEGREREVAESAASVPLLICGQDACIGGKSGRMLAERKIKEFLADEKKAAAATPTAAPAMKESHEAAEADFGEDSWYDWNAQSGAGSSKSTGGSKRAGSGIGNSKWRIEASESESRENWTSSDSKGNSRQNAEDDVWANWGRQNEEESGWDTWDEPDDWSGWPERGADSANVRKNTKRPENWTADAAAQGQDSWGKWQGGVATKNAGWGPAGRGGGNNRRR